MKPIYYARPMSLYGTPQEARDISMLEAMGYAVIEFNTPEIQQAVDARGMAVFDPLVRSADALAFRAFIDGSIGAGVMQEISWAQDKGIPVFELPSRLSQRGLSPEATRAMLAELGQR